MGINVNRPIPLNGFGGAGSVGDGVLITNVVSNGAADLVYFVECGREKCDPTGAIGPTGAQGPIGLCATAGARLKGAALIIAVESDPTRTVMAKQMGADIVLNNHKQDVVAEIKRFTGGKGVDVAVEALGTQTTFENALRALRAGGTLSSLGVYSGKLSLQLEPFAAGLGEHKIVTTLCPGGKERMRRLMELVRHGKLNLVPFLTHTYPLDRITDAYKLFGERRDGVIKVAIRP